MSGEDVIFLITCLGCCIGTCVIGFCLGYIIGWMDCKKGRKGWRWK